MVNNNRANKFEGSLSFDLWTLATGPAEHSLPLLDVWDLQFTFANFRSQLEKLWDV
jgi:hypothetical protein